jgi:hypothetical protein
MRVGAIGVVDAFLALPIYMILNDASPVSYAHTYLHASLHALVCLV